MQAYSKEFAEIYNTRWRKFAEQLAPHILDFYESTPIGQTDKSALDLCCGSGHLAVCFLERGYRTVGIDLSEHMLQHARENAHEYLDSGQARFIRSDVSDFTLTERFGLVVSTFDSLNHLENEQALSKCFQCVHDVCDGYFIFDLNTRKGLTRWNNITVDESDGDTVMITCGIFDEQSDKAWTKITGFTRTADGLYQRFDETVYNTVFRLERVKEALLESGWNSVHFARTQSLATPLQDPEDLGRVFVVASK